MQMWNVWIIEKAKNVDMKITIFQYHFSGIFNIIIESSECLSILATLAQRQVFAGTLLSTWKWRLVSTTRGANTTLSLYY